MWSRVRKYSLMFLSQVAPYERPALSKGFLLPEGIDSPRDMLLTGYFELSFDQKYLVQCRLV